MPDPSDGVRADLQNGLVDVSVADRPGAPGALAAAAPHRAMIGLMAGRRFASAFAGGALAAGMQRLNARHPWSHNDHFRSWIVANLPERCHTVLDVGCGRGELLAVLAPHVDRMIGIDIDATMRGEATRRCAGLPNVSVADGPWAQATGPFDVVTMVAVLHHLGVEDALRAVRGPDKPESIMIGEARLLAADVALPEKVTLRTVTNEADVRAMSAMQDEVFGQSISEETTKALLRPRTRSATEPGEVLEHDRDHEFSTRPERCRGRPGSGQELLRRVDGSRRRPRRRDFDR